MTDTVWAAIVGGAAGIITGSLSALVAPWANWGIKKKDLLLAHHRELVSKWRAMLEEAGQQDIGRGADTDKLLAFLEKHKDFYSLSAHLPTNSYEAYYKSHATLSVPVYHRYLTDEVSRIEREWDLV